MDKGAISEWERTHELIQRKRRHLTQLSVLHSRGELSTESLASARTEIEVLERLAGVQFKIAFGLPED